MRVKNPNICDNCKKTKYLSLVTFDINGHNILLGLCNECRVEGIDIPVEFCEYLDAYHGGNEKKTKDAWSNYLSNNPL